MSRKSSKDAILDAAERVINRQGLASTTIEGVAAEAGISKGGLFYHFASKKEMLLRLIERYQERFLDDRDRIMSTLPEGSARLLKATLIASIEHPARRDSNVANLISLLDDIDLREKIAAMKKKQFDEITTGAESPERVALAILAADGLWVAEMFGKPIFDGEFKKTIVNALLELIDEFCHNDNSKKTRQGAAQAAIG